MPELRLRLEPFADQLVVSAFAGFVAGSVAHYLALLSTTAGDWAAANR